MMMSVKEVKDFTSSIVPMLYDRKQVSRVPILDEKDNSTLEKYFQTIREINSLGRDVRSFKGEPLADFQIAEVFKDLVLPNSVTITGSPTEVDFLQRPESDEDIKVMDVVEFNQTAVKIYSAFRSGAQTVSITSLRKDEQVSTVIKRQEILVSGSEYSIHKDTPMVPLQLTVNFTLNEYFSVRSDLVMQGYWNGLFNSLAK